MDKSERRNFRDCYICMFVCVFVDVCLLVSYLLVNCYQNVRSYGAGMVTVLPNRIGDVALLMVIAWIINFGR